MINVGDKLPVWKYSRDKDRKIQKEKTEGTVVSGRRDSNGVLFYWCILK